MDHSECERLVEETVLKRFYMCTTGPVSEIFSNCSAEDWVSGYEQIGFQAIDIALDSAVSFGFGGFDQYAAALAAAALIHDSLKGKRVFVPESIFAHHQEVKEKLNKRILKLASDRVAKASKNDDLRYYYESKGSLEKWLEEVDAIFWTLQSQ